MYRSSLSSLAPGAVADTVTVHIEDIHGARIRLRPASAQLFAAVGHFRNRSRKTRYMYFDEAWLEADRQVFLLVNGLAAIHREGITVVAGDCKKVAADRIGISAKKRGNRSVRPARRQRKVPSRTKASLSTKTEMV